MASPPPARTSAPPPALEWLQASLAQVAGLPAGSALGVPVAGGGVPNALALRRFADALGRRFVRTRDASNRLRFETVGAPLAPLADTEADTLITETVRCYLGAARNATASIDPRLCLPDACPGEIEDALVQIRATLDALSAVAPLRGNAALVAMYVRELTDAEDGLLTDFQQLIGGHPATNAHERAQIAAGLALTWVGQFAGEFDRLAGGAEGSLADFGAAVRCAAESVPAYVDALGQAFEAAGITACELGRTSISGQPGDGSPSMADLERLMATQFPHWRALVEGERYGAVAAVRCGGVEVRRILDRVKADAFVKALGLDQETARGIEAGINRCVNYAKRAVASILDQAPPAPSARTAARAAAVIEDEAAAEIPREETGPLKPPRPNRP